MEKIQGNDLIRQIRRVRHICNTSVDDAKTDMQNENDLNVIKFCLLYESQYQNRSTMIRNLKARIKQLKAKEDTHDR